MGPSNPNLPNSELKKLDRLVGTWNVSGTSVTGTVTFYWFDGRFFLVQRVDLMHDGKEIKGVEYIRHDAGSGMFASHFFDNFGHVFSYFWYVEGDGITIWFGSRGSNNRFTGRFSEDGNSYSGAWEWTEGGYHATLTRVE